MMASFCKQIGDSLLTFGVAHQIIKHEYVPFTKVYIMLVVRWSSISFTNSIFGIFFPNIIVERLPLSKTSYDTFW